MDSLNKVKKLNVDGNKIAVFQLDSDVSLSLIEKDFELRKTLVRNFSKEIDTLMLYELQDDNVKCLAFEPNHGEVGGITTVCGNGLKAIASLLASRGASLHTKAGKFRAIKSKKNVLIDCGKFIDGEKIINSFLNVDKLELVKRVIGIFPSLDKYFPVISFGCNAENDNYIGEPHLVIGTFKNLSHKDLYELARSCGGSLRNSGLFKIESNITFFSFTKMNSSKAKIKVCTFERHLGNNPEIAITGSCGTGAMAVANVFLNSFLLKIPQEIDFELNFPEGNVFVQIKDGYTLLKGKNKYESI